VIDSNLQLNVAYIDIAMEIWEDLNKIYSVVNLPKMHQLKVAIANCKQESLDIGVFYNKLSKLWNELNNHVKVPVCTWKGCQCGTGKKLVQMYQEDRAHQFLMGLNDDEFSSVQSQLLAQDSLPSLDKIFM